MTARSPEDLLALAPVLLGFWPDDSVVMLTFAAARPFHARLALPARLSARQLDRVEQTMLDPAHAHGVGAVVFAVFGERERVARAVARTLGRGARRRGMEVVASIWADGSHYRLLGGVGFGGGRAVEHPVAYDLRHHPFVLEAMVEGRLQFASREEMVASLEPDVTACRAVEAAMRRLGLMGVPEKEASTSSASLQRLVAEHVRAGTAPAVEDLARLIAAVRSKASRDELCGLVRRPEASAHRAFWAAVLPRTPDDFVPGVADLLAFASWQSGDGAMAWAAVDRAQRADPGDSMARTMAGLLQAAVPPDAWPS